MAGYTAFWTGERMHDRIAAKKFHNRYALRAIGKMMLKSARRTLETTVIKRTVGRFQRHASLFNVLDLRPH